MEIESDVLFIIPGKWLQMIDCVMDLNFYQYDLIFVAILKYYVVKQFIYM